MNHFEKLADRMGGELFINDATFDGQVDICFDGPGGVMYGLRNTLSPEDMPALEADLRSLLEHERAFRARWTL